MPSKTLKSIRPNVGIETRYRRRLEKLISEMHGSFEYWLIAAYRKEPPRMAKLVDTVAADASPNALIQQMMIALGKRWIKKFNDASEDIAYAFITSQFKASDTAFMQALRDVGFAVKFTMTPTVRDAFNASVSGNVALIKSIPEQYLEKMQGAVSRAYASGRDLEQMTKAIQEIYPVTARRAKHIALDQSNKANAVVTRARQMELGITEATWMHSHAGKEPRQSHVKANGRVYKIAEGCPIDGEYIQPGELINCRCTSRPILPF